MDYRQILEKNEITLYGGAILPEKLRIDAEMKYAVSFAVPLPDPVVDPVEEGPTKTYFHHYRTCNAFLDQVAFRLVQAMMREGYQAMYVPASQSVSDDGFKGLFSHKAAACLAGLGGIGDNDLLVTKKYGCRVRLGTVLTNMPVLCDTPIENPCNHCGICVKACPCGALLGAAWPQNDTAKIVDVERCSMHMKRAYQKIGRGAVCGICMAVCPVGRKKMFKQG